MISIDTKQTFQRWEVNARYNKSLLNVNSSGFIIIVLSISRTLAHTKCSENVVATFITFVNTYIFVHRFCTCMSALMFVRACASLRLCKRPKEYVGVSFRLVATYA